LFGGTTEIEELREAVRAEIRSVVEVRPELGGDVDAVVMKALSPEPGDRFATARELGEALRELGRSRGLELDRSAIAGLMDGLFGSEREATEEMVEAATATAAAPAPAPAPMPRRSRAALWITGTAALAVAGVVAALVLQPTDLDIDVAIVTAPSPGLDAATPPAPAADAAPPTPPPPGNAAPPPVIDASPRRPIRRPPRRAADAGVTRSPPPDAAAAAPPPKPGTLVLDSSPWANAMVAGRGRGQTPLVLSLAPGRYPVVLTPSDGTAALRATAIIESGKRTKCIARSRRLGCSPPR
jgi:serine/threonine-protein kinase